jgi:FtsH-binding integral membrane protein
MTSINLPQTSNLPAATKQHLAKTYLSLIATVGASAVGAGLHLAYNIGGMLTQITMFITLMAFLSVPGNDPSKRLTRIWLLLAYGALQGASIGPLIEHVAFIDPSIVTSAFLGTTIVFACFSAAALVAERRSYLYLGGLLGSCLSLLFWGGLINMFFRSYLFFNVQLYLGLVMFVGYVVFDTQLIVEKHLDGDNDFLGHSMRLFIDFIAIFVRLLIILSRNSDKKRRRDNN